MDKTPRERFAAAGKWWHALSISKRRKLLANMVDKIPIADRHRSQSAFNELMFATRLALLKLYEEGNNAQA